MVLLCPLILKLFAVNTANEPKNITMKVNTKIIVKYTIMFEFIVTQNKKHLFFHLQKVNFMQENKTRFLVDSQRFFCFFLFFPLN